MTKEQCERIERLQRQSLKIIYGFDRSYKSLLEETKIEELQERRDKAVLKFAKKCIAGNFGHWFPPNQAARRTRKSLPYREDFARDRMRKTPIYTMRRALNAQEDLQDM